MKRIFALIAGLLIGLAFGASASASQPTPQDSDPNWSASYWNNRNLSGSPVLQRSEPSLDHNWGAAAPAAGVSADNFSARWTRYFDLPTGTYRITATYDDGIRIYLDGGLVLDDWSDHDDATRAVDVSVNTGHHLVAVEYYENMYEADVHVTIAPAATATSTWRGEYYNNRTLSGSPALVRDDANLDFHWGEASPAPGTINPDNFSARWTRNLDLPAGTYWFTLRIDDGARLWVNNNVLIDSWRDQPVQTYTANIYLPGGSVPVRLEYYEHTGGAFATLSWSTSAPGPLVTNWRGEYYNNRTLSGSPVLVRDDAQVDFDWGNSSPAGGVNADDFSVRWTRPLNLSAGTYRFTTTTDDGERLWVNGRLLLDDWTDHARTTRSADIYLTGGAVPVQFEYYEHLGGAIAKLSWAQIGGVMLDTIVVDNTDPGFSVGGTSANWHSEQKGWANNLLWTWNDDYVRSGYNWGRWSPVLAATDYEVFAHIPGHVGTTNNAQYWISHAGGLTRRAVDQVSAVDRWQSLGTYRFQGTDGDYVSLSDVTNEGYLTRKVVWDALKFERR